MRNKLREISHPARHAYFFFYCTAFGFVWLPWLSKPPSWAPSSMLAAVTVFLFVFLALGFVTTRIFNGVVMMRVADGRVRRAGLYFALVLLQVLLTYFGVVRLSSV